MENQQEVLLLLHPDYVVYQNLMVVLVWMNIPMGYNNYHNHYNLHMDYYRYYKHPYHYQIHTMSLDYNYMGLLSNQDLDQDLLGYNIQNMDWRNLLYQKVFLIYLQEFDILHWIGHYSYYDNPHQILLDSYDYRVYYNLYDSAKDYTHNHRTDYYHNSNQNIGYNHSVLDYSQMGQDEILQNYTYYNLQYLQIHHLTHLWLLYYRHKKTFRFHHIPQMIDLLHRTSLAVVLQGNNLLSFYLRYQTC